MPTPKITPLPPLHPPSHTSPPAHHTSTPPTTFRNPWPSYTHTTPLLAFRTRFLPSPHKNAVPVPPDFNTLLQSPTPPTFSLPSSPSKISATWIGHASFLITTSDGYRVLIDPVWSERVGPYGMLGPVRFTKTPCKIEEVPDVDAVLISHDHYDHLDSWTLGQLERKQRGGRKIRYFVPLGVRSILVGLGVGIEGERVTELDWWDGVNFRREEGGKEKGKVKEKEKEEMGSIDFICTPAQHRSGRSPWTFQASLWCSWVIRSHPPSSTATTPNSTRSKPTSTSLYFAGDTGYCTVTSPTQLSHHNAPTPPCPAFAEIGDLYGPFSLSLLPIGCYSPRDFMSSVHASPHDSIAIHKAVKSLKSLGMHYGTFRGDISKGYEPVTEPRERWKEAAEEEGLEWGREVLVCGIGGTVESV